MNAEWETDVSLIQGLMFGLEFPPLMEMDKDIRFAMVLDLGIVRIAFIRWHIVE